MLLIRTIPTLALQAECSGSCGSASIVIGGARRDDDDVAASGGEAFSLEVLRVQAGEEDFYVIEP